MNFDKTTFKQTPDSGLTTAEIASRTTQFGPNELVAARPVPLWRKIWQHMSDVSSLVLLFAVGLATYSGTGRRSESGSLPQPIDPVLRAPR